MAASEKLKAHARREWARKAAMDAGELGPSYVSREIPPTPPAAGIEASCRNLIPAYDPWRDAGDCVFDAHAARDAVGWFHKHLTHIRGSLGKQAFRLEPWQQAIIGNLFGWFRPDGLRRYRKSLIFIPQKNGKTAMAAGIALRLFIEDDEPGAEVYSAAYTREQARLVWGWARGMILNDEYLSARTIVYAHSIVRSNDENSFYHAIAAEERGVHGTNVHAGVIDELHTFTAAKEEVVVTLEEKTSARSQPMIVQITTAGYDHHSICYREYEYAKGVCDGSIRDSTFLPVIYEAPKDADWASEDVWRACNPNLGVSVSVENMRAACEKARRSPRLQNVFRRMRLNQWTESVECWIPADVWSECKSDYSEGDLLGEECYAGLDLSHTRDTSALAMCFPPAKDRVEFRLLVYTWLPKDDLRDREERDNASYREWSQAGWLKLTDGNVVDFLWIRAAILDAAKKFKVREIAYDRWNASQLVTELAEQHGVTMVEHGQGFASMSWPTKEFERLILGGMLRHNGNEMLTWEIARTVTKMDPAGNLKPDKAASNARIDGVVASIMACGLAVARYAQRKPGLYATRDPITIEW